MSEAGKIKLVDKLSRFISGEINYAELQAWLDHGGASDMVGELQPRERLYYSWMRQRLDQGEANDPNQSFRKREAAFFIRLLNGQVSWFERCRKWWGFW